MRRFLGIVMMGALALGVAHAEDYSSLSDKDFIKLAGTLHSGEEVLDYQEEVYKRLKEKKGKAKMNFKVQVHKTYKANLAKMSAKDFAALRKEVAEALEEKKKDHDPKELMSMGLDVEVCKGKQRELLCSRKHGKKHASKHGQEHGEKHGHEGMKHGAQGASKGEEHKASKAPAKAEEHKSEEHKEKSEGAHE
ncbi:DUF1104 domain-containing protein [Helicobacter labacensis]|uniref:DUF1104 domain-containing protein n=1 Tax=Helicobacter labacensis TaxID=2316079 RepID=UPI000EAD2640|nr:DUF1104 domain-containing protein [Helicobacter labacensis]